MNTVFTRRAGGDEFAFSERRSWAWWFTVWVPVAVAVAVIATESTTTFSGEHTSGWLRPVFEAVFGPFTDTDWGALHHLIRKTGHFVGYGLVCLTFLRAWLHTLVGRLMHGLRSWRARSSVFAVLSTASIASLDEVHQTMLPGRTGRAADVLLDTCGAAAMCLLVAALCWRRKD